MSDLGDDVIFISMGSTGPGPTTAPTAPAALTEALDKGGVYMDHGAYIAVGGTGVHGEGGLVDQVG